MAARVTGMPAPSRRGQRGHAALLALALAVLSAAPARATSPSGAMALGPSFMASESRGSRGSLSDGFAAGQRARWISLSGLLGSTQPDPGLADYQWDTTPHLAWGLKAMAGSGRFGIGLRMWNTWTTQDLGLAGEVDPDVTSTRLEMVASARIASFWSTDVLGTAGAGWLRLAYEPDEMTIDTGGGSTVVRFAPIDEWIWGGGVALRRPVSGPWALGLELDHRRYALDTAHRSGPVIVTSRPSFDEWSARIELAWTRGW